MTITVKGALKLLTNPDLECFTSFKEFVTQIPKLFGVEIPGTITNVIISNIEPNDTQRDSVWFRKSNGGTFLGIYLYSDGAWRQFFPVPRQVYRIAGGDSREVPEGFILTDDAGYLTVAEKDHLRLDWLRDPTDTYYVIFDVVPVTG